MKVESVFSIDGKVVDKVFTKNSMTVYEHSNGDDDKVFYFVQNGVVIFKQRILANCGQNYGYIDRVDFEEIED